MGVYFYMIDKRLKDSENRRCPQCQRKSALGSVINRGYVNVRICRWCGFEMIVPPSEPKN